MTFRLACVQVNSGNEIDPNIATATDLVQQAASGGADLVSLPECVALIEPDREALRRKTVQEDQHPALESFTALAAELNLWLHVGSLAVRTRDERIVNRSFLLDPGGGIVARYDKIHMFDVNLEEGESYRESETYQAGNKAVAVDLPWGRLGLTICYDVRFPSLYTHLARSGAMFISVPSAFTQVTGAAHWHVLLRARAIETGCWIFAAAQCGRHVRRRTFGHSLIVDPWGTIVADGGEDPGVIMAEINPERVTEARRSIPSLVNARPYQNAVIPVAKEEPTGKRVLHRGDCLARPATEPGDPRSEVETLDSSMSGV